MKMIVEANYPLIEKVASLYKQFCRSYFRDDIHPVQPENTTAQQRAENVNESSLNDFQQ